VPELRSTEDQPVQVESIITPPPRLVGAVVEDFVTRPEWLPIVREVAPESRLFVIEYEAWRRWRREVTAWGASVGLSSVGARAACGFKVGRWLPWRDAAAVLAVVVPEVERVG